MVMKTTVVGNYPKIPDPPAPGRWRTSMEKRQRGEMTPEEMHRVEDEVTAEVLAEMEQANLFNAYNFAADRAEYSWTNTTVMATQINSLVCPSYSGPVLQLGDATMGLCQPATCSSLGLTCGQNADGCGHLTPDCGTCTAPEFCGGGGPSRCGLGVSADGGALGYTADGAAIGGCVPTTCAAMGWNCGK